MPPRDNPTARQARLGAELRKLRDNAGKTAREAAGLLGTDQAKISHMEAGRIGISDERIRRLATFYSCTDDALITALCTIALEHRGQYWWDEYRGLLAPGFLDMAELEHHATHLRSVQTVTFPGLFQTEDYARTLFHSAVPPLCAEETEIRVEHRMRRRAIFDHPKPPFYESVMHEAALRMRFGGPKVTRNQLLYLLQVADQPMVSIRVIPFSCEEFIEATQPLLYASGPVPQLDTVQIDSASGGVFLDADAQLRRYQAVIDRAADLALSAKESKNLIHRIAREL